MIVFDIESDGLLHDIEVVKCINLIDRRTGVEQRYTDFEFYQDVDGKTTSTATVRNGTISDALALLEDAPIGGQNVINYDIPALQQLYPNWSPKGTVRDTLIESKLLYPDLKERDFVAIRKKRLPIEFQNKGLIGRNSLEAWGLRIGGELKADFNPKDYGHTWKTMPFTKEMDDYCMQDVRTNVAIFEHFESKEFFVPAAVELENRTAQIIREQCENGVHFNWTKAEALLAKLQPIAAEIESACRKVFLPWYVADGKVDSHDGVSGKGLFVPKRDNKSTGYMAGCPLTKIKSVVFNPASRDQIASRFIQLYDWNPLETTDTGKPKVDETILGTLPYPEAKPLAEYFTVIKRLGMLATGNQAWMKKVTGRGKIHGSVDTLGAITNRMTHRNPNLAQTPANDAPYGEDCRECFEPRPHFKQVGMDADGLEGRCLGHYLAPYDGGAYVTRLLQGDKSKGTDEHSANQKSVGMNSRANAKTIFYAFLYGSGDFNLGCIYVDDMEDEKREQFYAKYPAGRQRNAAVTRLGKRSRARLIEGIAGMDVLLSGVKRKARSKWIRAIDGRRLRVRSQHSALNTLLQGMGAIVMKVALVEADKVLRQRFKIDVDFAYLLNIHDEIQLECRPEIAEEIGKILAASVETAGVILKSRCPLAGSYDVGNNWSETH